MTFHTWLLFAATAFVLSAMPGPNMMHVMSTSIRYGVPRSVGVMAGCMLAIVLVVSASLAGMAGVLAASPRLFAVLRVIGAAYLVFLGVRVWRARDGAGDDGVDMAMLPPVAMRDLFRDGFLTGISNPKLLLFAAAFLPQFVNPAAARMPQYIILVVTFAAVEVFWYGIYAGGGRVLSAWLRTPVVRRVFSIVTGLVFMGFGAMLLLTRM
ncbi:LysE family translocator [Komagataeibacter oboediens]|uniref:LysE family translocator n=1 Tax=Komagataeibacter oboediens TaxID=65958 RepID=A0A318QU98_9PROT|nr:LysE family translocator [Komagataeibacter oboediens]MCK9819931.1 LysE family translocator [Komagataeibacter oboediens]PYD81524.1 LysE family translocator [Komagataeibacter oboediens]